MYLITPVAIKKDVGAEQSESLFNRARPLEGHDSQLVNGMRKIVI